MTASQEKPSATHTISGNDIVIPKINTVKEIRRLTQTERFQHGYTDRDNAHGFMILYAGDSFFVLDKDIKKLKQQREELIKSIKSYWITDKRVTFDQARLNRPV